MKTINRNSELQNYKVQIYVNKKVYLEVKQISKKQGRTVAELIREAIVKILKEYSNNPK
jgi:predicted DNA-binding protein